MPFPMAGHVFINPGSDVSPFGKGNGCLSPAEVNDGDGGRAYQEKLAGGVG